MSQLPSYTIVDRGGVKSGFNRFGVGTEDGILAGGAQGGDDFCDGHGGD